MDSKRVRAVWRGVQRALPVLAIVGIVGGSLVTSQAANPVAADAQAASASTLTPYVVRLGNPPAAVVGSGSLADAGARAHQQIEADLAAQLDALAQSGQAGAASYDAGLDAFKVDLTENARQRLAANPLVASLQPPTANVRAAASAPTNGPLTLPAANSVRGAQSVGSVNFIEVGTPFMWGRTNFGGLSVDISLENSTGQLKGRPKQTYSSPPNNYVQVDHTQLYYETLFVDVNDAAHQAYATILPGDRVHVVTTGIDPGTGNPATEDKRISVDDVRAWTSFDNDTVSGTGPPGSAVTVTVDSILWVTNYVTPGTMLTYAETNTDANGNFSIGLFRTTSDATARKVDLQPGTMGFVRVKHADGNEVFTVHGQNVFVPENSQHVHGYAFPLPLSPANLDNGVALAHPPTPVQVTLVHGGTPIVGALSCGATCGGFFPWVADFTPTVVSGGDSVQVTLWGAPARVIATSPIDAHVDVPNNQITGTAPANSSLDVLAGRIAGYITANSFFDFQLNHVAADGGGHFSSGAFGCGSNGHLTLAPGSFGFVGYENGTADFVYESIAAPTNHVLADFPYVEGWLANGAARPTLTDFSSGGAAKSTTTLTPTPIWLVNQKLFVDVYYQTVTSQFISPGDTVTVTGPSGNASILVDNLTSYMNIDGDSVFGDAPAGASLRTIPLSDRWAYRVATADGSGKYAAANPFRYLSYYDCSEQDKTEDLVKAGDGRVYLQHADGNAVFADFGRTMWVGQNGQTAEVWSFPTRGLDWPWFQPVSTTTVTMVLTPKSGSPITQGGKVDPGDWVGAHARQDFVNAQSQPISIRVGDSVGASFTEGLLTTQRQATLALASQPQVLAVPDVDSSTVAGIGPPGWSGGATLNVGLPPYGKAIPAGSLTAWGPLGFVDVMQKPVPLARGYSGTVAFTAAPGVRLWSAWATVALPTKIIGFLNVGDTKVCGTAAPNTSLRIHDMSSDTVDIVIATGSVGADGKFCATTPPLVQNQVILAEADGTYSQPVVVGAMKHTFISVTPRGARNSL